MFTLCCLFRDYLKFNRYHFFRIIKFPYESDIHEFWAAVLNDLLGPGDPYDSAEDWLSASTELGSHAAVIQRTVSDMRCTGVNRVRKAFFKELMLTRGWRGDCLFFKHGKCNLSAEQQLQWKLLGDRLLKIVGGMIASLSSSFYKRATGPSRTTT